MKEETRARLTLICGMIFGAALLRLMPHPPNFTPVAAIALFAGARLGRRWLAFMIPLAAMLVADTILEIISPWGGFHAGMPVVYGTFAVIVVLGLYLARRGATPGLVLTGALGSATLFFLTTNFAHWAIYEMYPKTLAGLVQCYAAAIPFFGNQLLGDLFYTGVLFGSFAWAERKVAAFAPARV